MHDWITPLLSFLGGAFGAAVMSAALSHFFQRRRYLQEQLIQRYSELVGIATSDMNRAKGIEAALAIGDPSGNEGHRKWLTDLIADRDQLRRDLSRVCFQVRLLEPDKILREQVQQLERAWPFIIPGTFGAGNFNERFEKFQKDIAAFRALLESIMERVQHKTHAWKLL